MCTIDVILYMCTCAFWATHTLYDTYMQVYSKYLLDAFGLRMVLHIICPVYYNGDGCNTSYTVHWTPFRNLGSHGINNINTQHNRIIMRVFLGVPSRKVVKYTFPMFFFLRCVYYLQKNGNELQYSACMNPMGLSCYANVFIGTVHCWWYMLRVLAMQYLVRWAWCCLYLTCTGGTLPSLSWGPQTYPHQ
jgi:hypothetical protein